MSKKILATILLTALLVSHVPAQAVEIENIHIPIISAPIGLVKGAVWGTKAFAGALGDEEHPLNLGLGLIFGAPLGAVVGTVTGVFGGPFSDKEKNQNKTE